MWESMERGGGGFAVRPKHRMSSPRDKASRLAAGLLCDLLALMTQILDVSSYDREIERLSRSLSKDEI